MNLACSSVIGNVRISEIFYYSLPFILFIHHNLAAETINLSPDNNISQ